MTTDYLTLGEFTRTFALIGFLALVCRLAEVHLLSVSSTMTTWIRRHEPS